MTQHYLRDALDAVLDGGTPPVAETPPVGCTIGRRQRPAAIRRGVLRCSAASFKLPDQGGLGGMRATPGGEPNADDRGRGLAPFRSPRRRARVDAVADQNGARCSRNTSLSETSTTPNATGMIDGRGWPGTVTVEQRQVEIDDGRHAQRVELPSRGAARRISSSASPMVLAAGRGDLNDSRQPCSNGPERMALMITAVDVGHAAADLVRGQWTPRHVDEQLFGWFCAGQRGARGLPPASRRSPPTRPLDADRRLRQIPAGSRR